MAVQGKGREGLLAFKDEIDGFADRLESGIFQRAFGKNRRITGGDKQDVTVARGHGELFGETKDHLAAGLGAACFKKAEMARGDFGFAGQSKLA